MGGVLTWVACLHRWHPSMGGVGGMLTWVACLRGWRANVGVVLT